MIADAPPVIQCVEHLSDINSVSIAVRGREDRVRSWLAEFGALNEVIEISASAPGSSETSAVIKFHRNTAYRLLGAAIMEAQGRQLNVSGLLYEPPPCEQLESMPGLHTKQDQN